MPPPVLKSDIFYHLFKIENGVDFYAYVDGEADRYDVLENSIVICD